MASESERLARSEPRRGERGARDARHPTSSFALTAALVALIALAVGTREGYLATVVVVAILALVAVFRYFFHASRAFCLTLANLAGIYACSFLFFVESNFAGASGLALSAGFALPLVAFIAGSFRYRQTIMRVTISGRLQEPRHIGRIFSWLVPILVVGIAVSLLPAPILEGAVNSVLLIAMLAISAFIFFVSRDIAVFLLDTGLLFEQFFSRIAALTVPAFAFLTCYSLMVILFASVYTVLDAFGGGANFRIDGVLQPISFSESLYYSVVTLSTVGYGDIVPASGAVRLVAAAEIVCGILLLLFGFNEIFNFARRHGEREGGEQP